MARLGQKWQNKGMTKKHQRSSRPFPAIFSILALAISILFCCTALAQDESPAQDNLPPIPAVKTDKYPSGPAPGKTITITAVGDVMLGTEGALPPNNGKDLLTAAAPILKLGDVVFLNYEGTLTDQGKPTKVSKSGRSYCFRSPPSYAALLSEAGFNMASLANNHSNDYGPQGLNQTLEVLHAQDITTSGPAGTFASMEAKGLKVAMAAYYISGRCNYLLDIPAAREFVARLAAENDIVIVSFHGGAEGADKVRTPGKMETYLGEKRGDVVKFSRAVVDAGADLVIGHGPHVPRAMEIYKERLIAYSLGNFCTGRGVNVAGVNGYAPILEARLAADGRLMGGKVHSLIQNANRQPTPDPENKPAKLIHELGTMDFPDSNAVAPDGTLSAK